MSNIKRYKKNNLSFEIKKEMINDNKEKNFRDLN